MSQPIVQYLPAQSGWVAVYFDTELAQRIARDGERFSNDLYLPGSLVDHGVLATSDVVAWAVCEPDAERAEGVPFVGVVWDFKASPGGPQFRLATDPETWGAEYELIGYAPKVDGARWYEDAAWDAIEGLGGHRPRPPAD